tara:strand:- start:2773 stop:2913 length:141 start_codon:yes stop_codon:yes gene_type:complete
MEMSLRGERADGEIVVKGESVHRIEPQVCEPAVRQINQSIQRRVVE